MGLDAKRQGRVGKSAPEDRAARQQWYRDMGWWSGEPLADRYARLAAARPEGLAVVDNRGHRLTHADLDARASVLAAELRDHGVAAGDVVLIYLPNWAVWQVVFLALLRVGAIPASLPITTDGDTLRYMAELVGARLLVAAEGFERHPLDDVANAVASACGHALDVLLTDEHGEFTWHPARSGEAAHRPDIPGLDHVMFTSSTTGRPKAAMHTADTLAALNLTFSERFDLGPERPIFMASPLGHSVGGIHGARLSLFNAAPLVLQERWDPEEALALIDSEGCAFTAAATPFLKDLVDASWSGSRPKLAPLSAFLCGGAQVPPALMEQAAGQFPRTFVTVLWGMTEGGLTTCLPDSPRDKVLATAGVGLPGLEICALDEQGAPHATDEEGELAMRGPGVFFGYLGQDELYQTCLTPDGFFRTGDLVRIDDEGYVRVTGRLKDLIIRGGVNISPVPTEDVLAGHPNVHGVAVIGLPDARMGERICAVIIPNGTRPSLEDLVAFAAEHELPKRQWPEAVHYVDEMPRTAAGKIRKNELRENLLGADGPDGDSQSGGAA
jgi:acyl-CoA synthetase (AMP-forming)/AMP-acid ligase II